MKIKCGFISNSSSASFIVVWNSKNEIYPTPFEAILNLYGINLSDIEGNYIEQEIIKSINFINKNTVIKDNNFETSVYTVMYNDVRDFPLSFRDFIVTILANSNFEIKKSYIEDDNFYEEENDK